jgi:hypothetical protein
VVCKDSANRWTENCQLLSAWFRKKGMEVTDEQVRQQTPAPSITLSCHIPSPHVPHAHLPSSSRAWQLFQEVGLPKDMDVLE